MSKILDMKNSTDYVFTEENFVISGFDPNETEPFMLGVGSFRINLTREEKERTIDTWNKLELLHKELDEKKVFDKKERLNFLAKEMTKTHIGKIS